MRAVELAEDGGATGTPQAAADAIRQIVKEWFEGPFLAEDPRWRSRLFVRSMVEPAELLKPVVAEILRPDTEALMAIFRTAKPDLNRGADLVRPVQSAE